MQWARRSQAPGAAEGLGLASVAQDFRTLRRSAPTAAPQLARVVGQASAEGAASRSGGSGSKRTSGPTVWSSSDGPERETPRICRKEEQPGGPSTGAR
eukprot:15469454-Alexandrium_andersonii.AAC.1